MNYRNTNRKLNKIRSTINEQNKKFNKETKIIKKKRLNRNPRAKKSND